MHGPGHIERRARAGGGYTYRATLVLGRKPDGSIDRKRETFDTEREAEEALMRWRVAHLDGTLVSTTRQTFGDYLMHWATVSKAQRIERTTRHSYEWMIRAHILPALGPIPLQSLRAAQIERFLADKAERGRIDGKGGLGDRMVQYLYALIKGALAHAVRTRLVAVNEAALVEPPRKRGQRRELPDWTEEHLERFLDAAEAHSLHPLWHITLLTGLRREELLGLRWKDVDFEAHTLRIVQCVVAVAGHIETKRTKNPSSTRAVHLTEEAVELLREHRIRQREHILRTRRHWQDHDLVFASLAGTALDPDNVSTRFRDFMRALDVPYVSLHGLRHMNAILGFAAGCTLHDISRHLGHSRASTTSDIYGQAQRGAEERVATAVASAVYRRKRKGA